MKVICIHVKPIFIDKLNVVAFGKYRMPKTGHCIVTCLF